MPQIDLHNDSKEVSTVIFPSFYKKKLWHREIQRALAWSSVHVHCVFMFSVCLCIPVCVHMHTCSLRCMGCPAVGAERMQWRLLGGTHPPAPVV